MNNNRVSRRDFVQGGLAAATALTVLPAGPLLAKEKAPTRPNILLIFSDQQHWRAAGFEDSFFDTPHLDALAKESGVFENSFCTTPQCSPSRSSLLTGMYPSKTGVMGNIRAAGGKPLMQETIAPRLQKLGYRTAYFGKWHLGSRTVATAGWDQSSFESNDSVTQSQATTFLKESGVSAKPFAMFVSCLNPHDIYRFSRHKFDPAGRRIPLPPSWQRETFANKPSVHKQFMLEDQGKAIWRKDRGHWERYRDCYRKVTRLYDNNLGAVLDELKRQGQWDNTVVIVTSDHGDMDTNHKLIYKGPFMYEHMVRVPLVIRVPKRFGGGEARRIRDVDAVNVDIAPTILDLCGASLPDCDGMSLRPTLTGSEGQKTRGFVIGQYYSKQRWVNPIRMIRTHEFKLNKYIRHGEEFYDLKNDPHELVNLAADLKYAKTKTRLSGELDRWIKENSDPFYSLATTTRSGKPVATLDATGSIVGY